MHFKSNWCRMLVEGGQRLYFRLAEFETPKSRVVNTNLGKRCISKKCRGEQIVSFQKQFFQKHIRTLIFQWHCCIINLKSINDSIVDGFEHRCLLYLINQLTDE